MLKKPVPATFMISKLLLYQETFHSNFCLKTQCRYINLFVPLLSLVCPTVASLWSPIKSVSVDTNSIVRAIPKRSVFHLEETVIKY